ncbi:hypothetical protein DL768_002024 [Monosporascus sp. mg162]|nr:hypothetical protein DL768_002024 [Monosporascus sp. mg162]
MDSTQPVKSEAEDGALDNSLLKAEPSDSTMSPASIPPMANHSPLDQGTSKPSAGGIHRNSPPGAGVSPSLDDLESHVKPDPAVLSQSMSNIPRSEVTPNVEPGVSAGASAEAQARTGPEADAEQGPARTDHLDKLVHEQNPEILEAGVEIGLKLLEQLKVPLEQSRARDAKDWLQPIDELRGRAKPPRTVVGVIGNTGAGKSSVINALLDEERRLLPTNCLRACTASPTEISYNYSTDPGELYRAEIEFISRQDWINELRILFSDLLDGNGQVSREANAGDSDAAVAYAKLKAVYPSKTKEMLAEGTPESFANEPAVRSILGSVKKLNEETASGLYHRLQHYVDSKEKVTGNENRKRVNVPMEYWPLIKVVRIYTKAAALSTGAVIVDLPGVQDSNAARAAVAANYQKSCTGLWIVAPITRAVDDKTAKTLLGDSFKRQLKYDGTYSAVSFICSKTDDISITEAAESLNLDEEISESWGQAEHLRETKESLQKQLRELKEEKAACGDSLDECDAKIDIWEELQNQSADGKTVYAPCEKSKKRKRSGKPLGSRKNRESSDIDDDEYPGSDSASSDKENSQPDENRQPLDKDEIDKRLSSLKAERKRIRDSRKAIDTEAADIRKEIQRVQTEREGLLAESKVICIKGRNEYSRKAIRHDFAMGIKELDQENAVEEDDTTFDPDQDIRDYDEVARSLPVFCVSSRAYQKLCGRLRKDDFQSHGFQTVDDTEIPKLQEHAKKLTEAGRASHCRRFLNDLLQLANSMKLWAANDNTRSTLTDIEKRREEMHLRKLLDDLERGLESSVKESISLLHHTLEEHIYEAFNALIPQAVNNAVGTAKGWGAHRSQGGLYWSTYKATVRRNGVWAGAAGMRDFNAELFDPISRNLATKWEQAFQRHLPRILDGFASKAKLLLNNFHEAARARAVQRHTNPRALWTLGNQILAHIRTLQDLPNMLRATITDLQRDASREFTPVIMDSMMDAYQACTAESGPGQYNRMKTIMVGHVDDSRHTMFRQATDTVKAKLQAMCRTVQKDMSDRVEDVFAAVFRDYMHVIVGAKVDRHAKLSPEEVATRTTVNDILHRGITMFAVPELSHGQEPEAMQGVVATPEPELAGEPPMKAEREPNELPTPKQSAEEPDAATAVRTKSEPAATLNTAEDPESSAPADPDELIQQQIREESKKPAPIASRQSQRPTTQEQEAESESDSDGEIATLEELFKK